MKIQPLFRLLKPFSFLLLILGLSHCTGEPQIEKEDSKAPISNEETIAQAAAFADTAQMNQYVLWNWEGAETAFQKALELDPNLGRAHAHYGWLHHLRGEEEKGLEEMDLAIQAEPQNPLWHAWKGWMLMGKSDGSEAVTAAQQGLEIDSVFSVSHYVIGMVYSFRGESESATEHMEIAAKDPMFIYGLGVALAQQGNKRKALEIAQQLSDTGETWNTLGVAEIYATLGEKGKAMEWVQKAFDQKHPYIPWIEKNPILASLDEQPGYQKIVTAMKLPAQ